MKKKLFTLIIFVLSLLSLFVSIVLLINQNAFISDNNLTAAAIYGGTFWLQADRWRLAFISIIVILSGINLFKKEKENKDEE